MSRRGRISAVRLDTISRMKDAKQLYQKMVFKELPAYTFNPIPGTSFMELNMDQA